MMKKIRSSFLLWFRAGREDAAIREKFSDWQWSTPSHRVGRLGYWLGRNRLTSECARIMGEKK